MMNWKSQADILLSKVLLTFTGVEHMTYMGHVAQMEYNT
jgi:hypothetical protein